MAFERGRLILEQHVLLDQESSVRSLIEVVSKDEGALVVFHFSYDRKKHYSSPCHRFINHWGSELWWGAARLSCHTGWRVLWRVFSMGRLWPRGIHTISEECLEVDSGFSHVLVPPLPLLVVGHSHLESHQRSTPAPPSCLLFPLA